MESPIPNLVARASAGFLPRRWLRGGHAQTLAGNFLPRPKLLPLPEARLFQVEPDAQVLCHCHWQPARQERFTILLVHGLEGSSQSQYVVGTACKAWQKGWNVVRMNVRNCGDTEKLCPTLYTSGLSADVRAVAMALIEQDGLDAIGLAGFSMGGNQVLKCAGEWGADGAAPGARGSSGFARMRSGHLRRPLARAPESPLREMVSPQLVAALPAQGAAVSRQVRRRFAAQRA